MLPGVLRVLSRPIFAFFLMGTLLAISGFAQSPPSIPPDVQAIMNKLSAGKPVTPQEQQRLQQWGQSMASSMGASKNTSTSGSQSNKPAPPEQNNPALPNQPPAPKISFSQLCPKPSSAVLPSVPPTAAEFITLVQSLVARYGAKLDTQTRAGIDRGAKQSDANAGSLPALLVVAGAIDEAVYAGAVAAQRDPLNANAANNLGVSLDQAGDYPDAARVLLYLVSMRPKSPLASVNLAWVYFNAGSSSAAKKQFVHSQSLGSGMAAPEEGQGLIAGCQGDMASAQKLLGASLKKGYSSAGAVGLMAAQQAQSQSNSATDAGWTPPDSEPPPDADSMIPEINVSEQMQYSPDYADKLNQLRQRAQSHTAGLGGQLMSASQRVAAINQRSRLQGDGAINLPLTFESELFEWKEVTDLAFRARFRNVDQVARQVTQIMNTNGETAITTMTNDYAQMDRIQKEEIRVDQDAAKCGTQACFDAHQKQEEDLIAQLKQVEYQMCLHEKSSNDVVYTQVYQQWKTQWDDFRPAAKDLYAFTNPILKRIWVPALYDFLSLQREAMVYSIYTPLVGGAAGLVKMGDEYKNMKCTPPPPRKQVQEAKDPDLPKEQAPKCPLGNGIGFGLLVVSIHIGCDSASIEGGEVLRFKASRDYATHSTTLWAGVGAGAETGASGDIFGPMTPKASIEAQTGVGVTIGKNGTVSDVFVSSELSASAGLGKMQTGMSASGIMSLENGASLSGNIAGFGGTIHE